MKLSPLLAQRSFDFFLLENEPTQVKLMNGKGIFFEMTSIHYIEIFNRLMNVGRIAHPIRVSLKSFNNFYMFKKVNTLGIMNFLKLKGYNKLSRLVSLGFNHKDLSASYFKEGEFDAKHEPKSPPNFIRFIIQLLVVDYVN